MKYVKVGISNKLKKILGQSDGENNLEVRKFESSAGRKGSMGTRTTSKKQSLTVNRKVSKIS